MPAPFDAILVLDFETRWDSKDYTLSKMTTESYIRDKRFKAFGVGYKWYGSGAQPEWVPHAGLPAFFASINWRRTAIMCHNAQFDGAILAWHYGCVPSFYFDTLSMARALRGVEVGNSAAKLAAAFNLPPKGRAVHSTDGLTELPPHVEEELATYCHHDVWLCEQFYINLADGFSRKELELIDMTVRMFTQPYLRLDAQMLTEAIEKEEAERTALLTRLNISDETLASNAGFAQALEKLGVTPPTKARKPTPKNPNPQGVIPAFAKTDVAFQSLLNGDDDAVATLCEARLKVKSTLERTRAQRFLDIAGRGTLPIPLSYYGAHTGRWSAAKGSMINMQNLKRKSFLRKAIMAPPGYVLVVADLSQIEPRVLAWLAGDEFMLRMFSEGKDPYATFGARMFNVPGMTKESHPDLRQSAKSALLGCGYGLGWRSFAAQLMAGFLGAPPVLYDKAFLMSISDIRTVERMLANDAFMNAVNSIPHVCTFDELFTHCVATTVIVNKYRATSFRVKELWQSLDSLLPRMSAGAFFTHMSRHNRLSVLEFDGSCCIKLPNGMALRYADLHYSKKDEAYVYTDGKGSRKSLYGGRMTENIVQALARIVMTDGMLRIKRRYPVLLTVHDEAVMLVPEEEGKEATEWCRAQMIIPPKWAPSLPLDAEADFAVRYGDCK